MQIGRAGLLVSAFAAITMMAYPALAQYQGDRGAAPKQPAPQNQQAPKKATCVASGFAKLKRNCTADTGGCQRMPDSCSNGWCCP